MPRKNKPPEEKPTEEKIVDANSSGSDAGPELPFDITKIDPEKIRLAEEMGIPIGKMLQWIVHTEQRLNIIIANMPNQKQIEKAMNDALINIARQRQTVKTGEGQPQGGQRGSSMIENLILKALAGGGGGGQDEEMLKLNRRFIEVSINNMQKRADASDRIVDAVVTNIVSQNVKQITAKK